MPRKAAIKATDDGEWYNTGLMLRLSREDTKRLRRFINRRYEEVQSPWTLTGIVWQLLDRAIEGDIQLYDEEPESQSE